MAAISAPKYFDAVKLGGHIFIDGGISSIDILREGINDVAALAGGSLEGECVVSIDAASSPKSGRSGFRPPLDEDVLQERGTSYFRLTNAHVVDVGVDEWKKIPEVYAAANQSLYESEMKTELDICVDSLVQSIRDRQNPNNVKKVDTKVKGGTATELASQKGDPTSN